MQRSILFFSLSIYIFIYHTYTYIACTTCVPLNVFLILLLITVTCYYYYYYYLIFLFFFVFHLRSIITQTRVLPNHSLCLLSLLPPSVDPFLACDPVSTSYITTRTGVIITRGLYSSHMCCFLSLFARILLYTHMFNCDLISSSGLTLCRLLLCCTNCHVYILSIRSTYIHAYIHICYTAIEIWLCHLSECTRSSHNLCAN